MSLPEPESVSASVRAERRRHIGILTLNRPQALNALSLEMVRSLTAQLLAWRDDPDTGAVVLRGANRPAKAPAFCAGGDIRYFHEAALAGDPSLEDFFTEEYALNHLIHTFGKPIIALMDGITMGGGMGLAQGAALRVVTEHGKLAMPETQIGLFPDVGGGWFLARCPGHLGEYLGLTGQVLGPADALAVDWADICIEAARLDEFVQALADETHRDGVGALSAANAFTAPAGPSLLAEQRALIDRVFAPSTLAGIFAAVDAESGAFAASISSAFAKRSPLMMAVTLRQIRLARASGASLADELRVERGLVRHCFHLHPGRSETLEGIRALVIDKDQSPRWNPPTVATLTEAEVNAFFVNPWPSFAHPLRLLA